MRLKNVNIHNFKGLEAVQLENCGSINAIVGKNNSGKSSVLHALDMAGLALSVNQWNIFQPKLEIKDLFNEIGEFSIELTYEDNSGLQIRATPAYGPQFEPQPTENQRYKSILILPDVGNAMLRRRHRTPLNTIQNVENRDFSEINSLEILYAIKFYALRNERGLTSEVYESIINEIKHYFPEIEEVESDRTEEDIATLTYSEYGKQLDILYSGTGLKHFLDVLLKTIISGASVVLLDEPEMGLHPDLQRRFITYLHKVSDEKNIQFFLATHSQVLLNYADTVNYYRIINTKGNRKIIPVRGDAIQTLLSDLGLRPSDVFNQDICILLEGATEIVFFEHIIRNLYKTEFENIAIGILQYCGGAAEGIISGSIDVSNITPAQIYTFWIRDRDAPENSQPSENSRQFVRALQDNGLETHIWSKREIEYYFPDNILVAAQQGDQGKENQVLEIKNGDQTRKFQEAASDNEICVPNGLYLKRLLNEHLTDKNQLDVEIRNIIEQQLIPWGNEILGE